MLYLVTGTPGAGKTLNTIKFVNEEDSFQGRPVYYFNIKQLDRSFNWIELSEPDLMQWFELPEGAIIVIDEAYDIFPQRGPTQKAPEHVKRLATHRHRGYDIVLLCQKVKGQLDSFIRGLVNYHYHYERRFGTEVVVRYSWERCVEDINNYHERKQALKTVIKYDRKYFGAYHSAEVHTVKRRLPIAKIAIFPVLFSVLGFCAYSLLNTLFSDRQKTETVDVSAAYLAPTDFTDYQPAAYRSSEVREIDWYEARVARVRGFDHTAPVYDELTKPVTFPRPNCIHWDIYEQSGESRCQCYSQQATKMDVPRDICLQIVKNGWFDATRPDTPEEKEYARNLHQRQIEQQPASRGYVSPESHIISEGSHLIWQASVK